MSGLFFFYPTLQTSWKGSQADIKRKHPFPLQRVCPSTRISRASVSPRALYIIQLFERERYRFPSGSYKKSNHKSIARPTPRAAERAASIRVVARRRIHVEFVSLPLRKKTPVRVSCLCRCIYRMVDFVSDYILGTPTQQWCHIMKQKKLKTVVMKEKK